jgi:transcriptional regulator with XRE-family HTH domain
VFEQGDKMTIHPQIMTIRAKKLGVLMRDARFRVDKSAEECSQAIGVSKTTLEAYEFGEQSPSLPELELLAYYLEVPLEYFWGSELKPAKGKPDKSLEVERILAVRRRVIGANIKKARIDSGLSIEQLAEETNIEVGRIDAYEMGGNPIPLPELEVMAIAVNVPIKDFLDRHGPAGAWFIQKRAIDDFMDLPVELQEFVSMPVNRPYLEIAQRLSEMDVEKLRAVAEGLLEITL